MRLEPLAMMLVLAAGFMVAVDACAAVVRFEVTVPEGTPDEATIFASGSAPALGSWNGVGLALERREDGIYVGTLELAQGQTVTFKVTRGSWATVEKATSGAEIPNREYTVQQDAVLRITVAAWADGGQDAPAAIPSSRSGDIRDHPGIASRFLAAPRDVWVCLPPGYEDEPARRYPVLYMHDGQNVFDAATSFLGVEWSADETAERLIAAEAIEPLIIVAIANSSQRLQEYTPGESGRAYGRFIVEELKPMIDAAYRTHTDAPNTMVAGSSLGGLVSLTLAHDYPEVFGRCAALSPSLWWNDLAVFDDYADVGEWGQRSRFWVDMGSAEGSTPRDGEASVVAQVERFGAVLAEAGVEVRVNIVADGVHNEASWADRFDEVLIYLLAD